jgi:hypothetical protein
MHILFKGHLIGLLEGLKLSLLIAKRLGYLDT